MSDSTDGTTRDKGAKVRRGPAKRADSPHRARNADKVADALAAAQNAQADTLPKVIQNGAAVATHVAPAEPVALDKRGEPWRANWKPPSGALPTLRAAAPRAAKVLEELQDQAEAESVRLAAANSILDRVLGKATQAVALAVATVTAPTDGDGIDALARLMVVGDDAETP